MYFHSAKFDKVNGYYLDGLWTKGMVKNAVENPPSSPWITASEYEEITGEKYYA